MLFFIFLNFQSCSVRLPEGSEALQAFLTAFKAKSWADTPNSEINRIGRTFRVLFGNWKKQSAEDLESRVTRIIEILSRIAALS